MIKWPKLTGFVAILLAFSTACERDDCEGTVPSISYKNLGIVDGNEAIVSITFKDCDGDIGLEADDTTGVYAPDSNNRYHYNLYIDYYEKVEGEWEPLESFTRYRVPRLENDGSSRTTEGTIEVNLTPYFAATEFDTFRYELVLIDRALNESNRVTSPTYTKSN